MTADTQEAWPYFAYGSNLWVPRLQARTPSARLVSTGYLECHQLRFHKRGDDGSGKCDAFFTGNPSDRTYGALYHLDPHEKPILDAIEGVGVGYALKHVQILGMPAPTPAWMYVAQDGYRDSAMVPFDWYHAFVQTGARAHGFPAAYLENLANQPTRKDPDSSRRAQNLAVLDQLVSK